MKAVLVLIIALLAGCSTIKGVTLSDDERRACEASGCTVWTEQDLEGLARLFFQQGYMARGKSL